MLKLHIKGPRKTAQRAAARAGVPVKHCTTRLTTMYANTYAGAATNCDAPCSARGNVMRWYGQRSPKAKSGRGLAPGTLLFFAAGRCDTGFGGARGRRRRRS